jgi:hypothetical protein
VVDILRDPAVIQAQDTTPAHIFGRSDTEWGGDSAIIVGDAGGGMKRIHWINNVTYHSDPEVFWDSAMDYIIFDDGVAIDMDFAGWLLSISYDTLDVVFERVSMSYIDTPLPGIQTTTDGVWFETLAGDWCVAMNTHKQYAFEHDDVATTASIRRLNPIYYTPGERSAEVHARIVLGRGALGGDLSGIDTVFGGDTSPPTPATHPPAASGPRRLPAEVGLGGITAATGNCAEIRSFNEDEAVADSGLALAECRLLEIPTAAATGAGAAACCGWGAGLSIWAGPLGKAIGCGVAALGCALAGGGLIVVQDNLCNQVALHTLNRGIARAGAAYLTCCATDGNTCPDQAAPWQ